MTDVWLLFFGYTLWWAAYGYAFCFFYGWLYQSLTGKKVGWPIRPLLIALGGPLMWFAYGDEKWWRK